MPDDAVLNPASTPGSGSAPPVARAHANHTNHTSTLPELHGSPPYRQALAEPPDITPDEIEPLEPTTPPIPTPATPPLPASPLASTPGLASPFSLHQVGISPLAPLRRQFSSPRTSATPPGRSSSGLGNSNRTSHSPPIQAGELGSGDEETRDDDLTQDSKDVLIQRLGDLARRLLHHGTHGDISTLHAKVDEMEGLLAPSRPKPRRAGPISQGSDPHAAWPPSPSWFRSRLSDLASLKEAENPIVTARQGMVPADAERITAEAELLTVELERAAENLKARQEESDHIHSLLVERAERAAQRIIFLQDRVTHLEEDLQENDSDLTFLRLGLKAIEVQCPPNTDIELRQSIDNWKADWARLKQKRARQLGRESAGKDISIFRSPRTPR